MCFFENQQYFKFKEKSKLIFLSLHAPEYREVFVHKSVNKKKSSVN